MEKAIDRAAPTDDDISKEFDFDLIEPFETPTGATLSHMSAISQLNRYCMSLPVDQFTTSAVILKKQTHSDGMISMSVQLPIQSMIRDEIMVGLSICLLSYLTVICHITLSSSCKSIQELKKNIKSSPN